MAGNVGSRDRGREQRKEARTGTGMGSSCQLQLKRAIVLLLLPFGCGNIVGKNGTMKASVHFILTFISVRFSHVCQCRWFVAGNDTEL